MTIEAHLGEWEQQCCGEVFRIGSAVTWKLVARAPRTDGEAGVELDAVPGAGTQLPGCSTQHQLLTYRVRLEVADVAEQPAGSAPPVVLLLRHPVDALAPSAAGEKAEHRSPDPHLGDLVVGPVHDHHPWPRVQDRSPRTEPPSQKVRQGERPGLRRGAPGRSSPGRDGVMSPP